MISRCLDCGAERNADTCEACGLSTVEAEFAFRRRLLSLVAVFLFGSIAFLPVTLFYPPLELDGILIFFGVLFFVTLLLAGYLDRRARKHLEIEAWKRLFRALIPLPWLLAGLLFANGKFDSSEPKNHRTVILDKFSMPGALKQSRITVISWRVGRNIERVPVSRDDYLLLAPGDQVEVRVQDGLVGIPWVYSVYRK